MVVSLWTATDAAAEAGFSVPVTLVLVLFQGLVAVVSEVLGVVAGALGFIARASLFGIVRQVCKICKLSIAACQ